MINQAMKTVLYIYYVAYIQPAISQAKLNFTWKPRVPILFNQDALLECFIQGCHSAKTQWIGGRNKTLLTYKKLSVDHNKYEANKTNDTYNLVIKDFSVEDAHCLYTCQCGFLTYTKELKIVENIFYLLPTDDTIIRDINLKRGILRVEVYFVEVYPLVTCEIFFKGTNVSKYFTADTTGHENGYFFVQTFRITHRVCNKKENCDGLLKMSCVLGIFNITVLEVNVTNQLSGMKKEKSLLYYILMSVMAAYSPPLTCVCVISIINRWKQAQQRAKTLQKENEIRRKQDETVVKDLIPSCKEIKQDVDREKQTLSQYAQRNIPVQKKKDMTRIFKHNSKTVESETIFN